MSTAPPKLHTDVGARQRGWQQRATPFALWSPAPPSRACANAIALCSPAKQPQIDSTWRARPPPPYIRRCEARPGALQNNILFHTPAEPGALPSCPSPFHLYDSPFRAPPFFSPARYTLAALSLPSIVSSGTPSFHKHSLIERRHGLHQTLHPLRPHPRRARARGPGELPEAERPRRAEAQRKVRDPHRFLVLHRCVSDALCPPTPLPLLLPLPLLRRCICSHTFRM